MDKTEKLIEWEEKEVVDRNRDGIDDNIEPPIPNVAAGSTATPEQNDVGELGAAMGVTYQDNEELKAGEKERERDKKRWELDPASSEDYQDRTRE